MPAFGRSGWTRVERRTECSSTCTVVATPLALSLSSGSGWRRCAGRCQLAGLLVDYRLAGDAPYPAAVDDALAVTTALSAGGETAHGRWALSGDSAGGGLAAVICRRLVAHGHTMPAGLVLMSPWVDMPDDPPADSRGRIDGPHAQPSHSGAVGAPVCWGPRPWRPRVVAGRGGICGGSRRSISAWGRMRYFFPTSACSKNALWRLVSRWSTWTNRAAFTPIRSSSAHRKRRPLSRPSGGSWSSTSQSLRKRRDERLGREFVSRCRGPLYVRRRQSGTANT